MDQQREGEIREQIARLWGQAEGSVQAYVFSAVSGFQDAEDVVQNVALSVARRFHEYDCSRPFVAWVLWLAKSHIIDHYRRQERSRMVVSEALLDRIAEVMAVRQPRHSERQAALEQCIEKLPARSRRLINLRYADEQSAEAIARVTDSTAGSVRVTLLRIRDLLADCVRRQLPSQEGGL